MNARKPPPVKEPLAPHSEECEKAALLCCATDYPQVAEIVFELTPEDFFLAQNRERYKALQALRATGKLKTLDDGLMVAEELKAMGLLGPWGDRDQFDQWHFEASCAQSTWANVEAHCHKLKEYAERRRALETADLLQRAASDPQNEIGGVLKTAQKTLKAARAVVAPRMPAANGNGSTPHLGDHVDDDIRLHEYLGKWQFTFRVGSKLYSEVLKTSVALTGLYNLSGAMEIFRSCPAYMRDCNTQHKTFSLAKETFKMLGHVVWENLPERTPDKVKLEEPDRAKIKGMLVNFLTTPRLYYGEGHIPLNISYSRWAVDLPDGVWRDYEGHPLYARKDGQEARIAVQASHLLAHCTGLKAEVHNEVWAGKILKDNGLLKEHNGRSSFVIWFRARCVRVWEFSRSVVNRATGTEIEPEGFEIDNAPCEPVTKKPIGFEEEFDENPYRGGSKV